METADLCGLSEHVPIERLDARDRGSLVTAPNELRTVGDTLHTS